jgi:hypothetical protein
MEQSPYLVAFKATSMETRQKIIEWLRLRDATHVPQQPHVRQWLGQTNAGDIAHSIKQYDEFGASL